MTQWKLPENLQDLPPIQAKKLETLRRKLLDLFERSGYEFVMPSLLEYEDSLNAHGRDLNLDTFKVVDQLSGKMMGITSDLTTQTSRMDAYLSDSKSENKFCYAGPVIRTKASQDHSRELYQIGIEYYGNEKIDADKEVIITLIKSLKLLKIKDITIDINHLDIFNTFCKKLVISKIDENKFAEAVMLKDKNTIKKILDNDNDQNSITMILQLLEIYGDKNSIIEIESLLKSKKISSKCLDSLKQLIQVIEDAGAKVSFDFSDIRGYKYHSGLIFSAYSSQFKSVIAQGGRYDNLNKDIGQDRAATGFSLDLRYLINHL